VTPSNKSTSRRIIAGGARGEGLSEVVSMTMGRWDISILLDSGVGPGQAPRTLMESTRTQVLAACGIAHDPHLRPELVLEQLMTVANHSVWGTVRTNPAFSGCPVGLTVFLGAGDEIWAAHAGAARVLVGSHARGFSTLIAPSTAAARMLEDGTVEDWETAPKSLRQSPLQGVGLHPGDFAPLFKGPIFLEPGQYLVALGAGLSLQVHPSDLDSFVADSSPAEATEKLLDYGEACVLGSGPGLLIWHVPGTEYGSAQGTGDSGWGRDASLTGVLKDVPRRTTGSRGRWFWVILLLSLLGALLWWLPPKLTSERVGGTEHTSSPPDPPPIQTLYRGERPPVPLKSIDGDVQPNSDAKILKYEF